MMRTLFFTLMLATIVALSAVQPLFAQDRTPDPAAAQRTEESRPGAEGDPATGEPDGGDAGHWETECWEEPDDDMIYCDDIWVSDSSGDWDGDGVVDAADF